MKNKLMFVFLLIDIIFLTSCGDDQKSFTSEEYKIIDSIYRIKKKEYKTTLDTLCDSVYNAEYPIMVDSIKVVRKKEILDLIEE